MKKVIIQVADNRLKDIIRHIRKAKYARLKICVKREITLHQREKQVLRLVVKGLKNNEIAERLNLSKRTIDGYRSSLLKSTKCKNTASLVKYAINNGYV